jgi:hypothetical protein
MGGYSERCAATLLGWQLQYPAKSRLCIQGGPASGGLKQVAPLLGKQVALANGTADKYCTDSFKLDYAPYAGTGEGSVADPASTADLSVNFNTDGEIKLKLLDTSVTPACPAANTSALIDSITACDDYCARGAWSFASLDWSVAAGSDIFGWQAAMPLLSSKPQPQAWPTCPNHSFRTPPPCPGNSTNGTAGSPGVAGAGPGGVSF